MKNKRWMIALMAALIILTAQPVCSLAVLSDGASFVDTDVSCTVAPVFEFTLPPDATIRYPNTQAVIGRFGVSELLLESGEALTVELVPGAMAARGTGGALPYSVSFTPPAVVDETHVGQSYDVVVTIDPAAYAATRRTFHDATLTFRVRSLLSGAIIWQGVTTVTARKTPAVAGGNAGEDDNPAEGIVPVPATGDDTITDESIPQGDAAIEDTAETGETITDEDIPEVLPVQAGFWWWWIPVAALAAMLLFLLLFLILRRRKKQEEREIQA